MVRWICASLAVVVLAGCGQERKRDPVTPHTTSAQTVPSNSGGATPARRQMLVYFKDVYGVDPLASYLTVYTNGQAVAVIIAGGVDGASVRRFHLNAGQLQRLKRLVADTRLRSTTCCSNVNGWIFWVTTRKTSARLQQASIPRATRPLVNELFAITQANTIY